MKLTPSRSIWFNGKLVPWDEAQVHVLTHALHYASSVFEGIRAYRRRTGPAVFGLDAHVERLFHSCKIVRLPIPFEKRAHPDAILETVRENEHEACYIRPLVYRGYGALGVWPDENPVEVAIATFPWIKTNEQRDAGEGRLRRRVVVAAHGARHAAGDGQGRGQLRQLRARRDAKPSATATTKASCSTSTATSARAAARTSSSCRTARSRRRPSARRSWPASRARCVLQLGRELGLADHEQRIPREMLYTADEAFFSGTVAEVTPIHSIDGLPVGAGRAGPVTKRIQERFFALTRGESPDVHGWLTPVRL